MSLPPKLASPRQAESSDRQFDSLPKDQRLLRPEQYESWKDAIKKRLRELGLSHVPLKRPAQAQKGRKTPNADELRRVAVMLKWSVSAKIKNTLIGGHFYRGEQPCEVWSKIRAWANAGSDSDSESAEDEGVSDGSFASLCTSLPNGIDLEGHTKKQLKPIASIKMRNFRSIEAYVVQFNTARNRLLRAGIQVSDSILIMFFIAGIDNVEAHKDWIIRALQAVKDDHKNTKLNWVQYISGGLPQKPPVDAVAKPASPAARKEEHRESPSQSSQVATILPKKRQGTSRDDKQRPEDFVDHPHLYRPEGSHDSMHEYPPGKPGSCESSRPSRNKETCKKLDSRPSIPNTCASTEFQIGDAPSSTASPKMDQQEPGQSTREIKTGRSPAAPSPIEAEAQIPLQPRNIPKTKQVGNASPKDTRQAAFDNGTSTENHVLNSTPNSPSRPGESLGDMLPEADANSSATICSHRSPPLQDVPGTESRPNDLPPASSGKRKLSRDDDNLAQATAPPPPKRVKMKDLMQMLNLKRQEAERSALPDYDGMITFDYVAVVGLRS